MKSNFIASRASARKSGAKSGVTVNKPPSQSEIQRVMKDAQRKYQRLSPIVEILKGSGRERYDFFLANGFPTWRGTGYYYSRYRPGLGSVLVGLFVVFGGAAHYGALYLGWKRQRDFVERYIRHARRSAWGDESAVGGIPGIDGNVLGAQSAPEPAPSFAQENGAAVLNRRQKREQEKEAKKQSKKVSKRGGKDNSGTSTPVEAEPAADPTVTGPQGSRKKVMAENGKVLIVDSFGHVFLEQEDDEGEKGEYLLDPTEIPKPTVRDTFMYRFPIWAYEKAMLKIKGEPVKGQKLGSAEVEIVEGTSGSEKKANGSGERRRRK